VFIVGQARSGSSILYRLIQEHPTFRPAGGLNLAESHLLHTVATERSIDVPSTRAFAGLDDATWRALVDEIAGLEWRRRLAVSLPERALQRSVALWVRLGCETVVQVYFWYAAQARRAGRLVEKTPQNLPWTPHLLHAFPHAQVLVICRHPLPTFASFLRRAAEDPGASWAKLQRSRFVELWRSDAERTAQLAARDERVRVLHYEQLVDDPETAQAELFAWLGEPARESLPAAIAPSEHAPVSDAKELYGPITPTGRDWSKYVTAEDARAIQQELAAPMALVGYEPIAG